MLCNKDFVKINIPVKLPFGPQKGIKPFFKNYFSPSGAKGL